MVESGVKNVTAARRARGAPLERPGRPLPPRLWSSSYRRAASGTDEPTDVRSNDQPIGSVLRQVVRELSLGPKLAQSELRALWERELGPVINRHTTEVSFRAGTLYVHVNSSPLRHELMLNRAQLVQRLNDKLSDPVVQELVVR